MKKQNLWLTLTDFGEIYCILYKELIFSIKRIVF
jgi:hypothetical protein